MKKWLSFWFEVLAAVACLSFLIQIIFFDYRLEWWFQAVLILGIMFRAIEDGIEKWERM